MNNLFLYEGSKLFHPQDEGSVVYPGVMQYPVGLEVDVLNYMGFVVARGTVTQSYCKKFDRLSNFELEDAFHPKMRFWGNAHEALSKEYPEFGLADLVTVVRFRVDEIFECPLMPTQEAVDADIKELDAQTALGEDA
jgi:hypothetical protein